MEIKTSSIAQRLGRERQEYLYLARVTFANSGYVPIELLKTIGFLKAWESTLAPGSEEKKELIRRKETIEEEKELKKQKWGKEKESLSVLQKLDNQHQDLIIEAQAVEALLSLCGELTTNYGLDND